MYSVNVKFTKHILVTGFILAAILQPATARADEIVVGVLNVVGTATISLASIDFIGNELILIGPNSAQQGGFTALAGTTGSIGNIVNPPDASGPLNVPDFIAFAADPNISITLAYLYAGTDGSAGCAASAPAAGQLCTPDTPVQSPLDLQNTGATSATASFDIFGTEVDSTTGDTIPVSGIFTMPFANKNLQEILGIIDGGGSVTTPFVAQFATSVENSSGPLVPEPSTLLQSLSGLDLLALLKRRSSRLAAMTA